MARVGDVGFLLAEEDQRLLGLLGWQVENLVACVTDLLISPAHERQRVGRALFKAMESAALSLQAEAALLCLPPCRVPELVVYLEDSGYLLQTVKELPRAWREMALRAGYEDGDEIPLKELRSDRVVRPL
jgi:N-acetylglutamate synthase-like GNAT family acetyltransferase